MAMRIEVQGIPIDIHVRGEGRSLLMLHGWSADHAYLAADLDALVAEQEGWRRIYFDLPGHGTTPAPDWLNTQEQMLEIVTSIADQVIGEEPFAVAGNSYGGYLTLGLVRTGHDKCALVMSSLHRERTWIARGWVSVARPLVLRAYHYSVR